MWRSGDVFDAYVYLTTFERSDPELLSTKEPIWKSRGLTYDCEKRNELSPETISIDLDEVSADLNRTLWANVYFVRKGYSLNPSDDAYRRSSVVTRSHPMTRRLKQKETRTKRLLDDEPLVADDEDARRAIVPQNYWIPLLDLRLIHDFSVIKSDNRMLPRHVIEAIQFDDETGNYFPHLYVDDLLLLESRLLPMNDTVLPLTLSYQCMSLFEWQMKLQLKKTWSSDGIMGDSVEDVKRMFLETNPYLLGVTLLVTMLHMLFDCLAMKNDIEFWRNSKSMRGLSLRSLLMSVFFQIVIFLYLLDSEKTSRMILFSRGMGLAIAVWKCRKAISGIDLEPSFPFVRIRSKLSYVESNTKKFDDVAMNHLFYVIGPGVVGYALYALAYYEFKSWYSYVISSLVGFIYVFGFVLMTPQLFLNYKLKSVKHMNWRSLVYRSLNTFIDDLYALIIPMPTMHRIACLRDDVIFLIFLYQRWIYAERPRNDEAGGVAVATTGKGADERTARIKNS